MHTLASRASPARRPPELSLCQQRRAGSACLPASRVRPPARRADVLAAWKCDVAAQRAFRSREKALRAFFVAMCAKGGGPSSRSVRMDVLLRELETRKVGVSRPTPQ